MKILHLEDNVTDAEFVGAFLREEWPQCETTVVDRKGSYVEQLQQGRYDVILSDFSLASFTGEEGFRLARELAPDTPFIFFSGTIREELAIEAVRDGAADYVLKERPMRLITAIRHALRKRDEALHRRLAESKLREQSELLDRARDAIVVSDLENRILYWNQGAFRILGWSAEELVGQSFDRFASPTTLAAIQEIRTQTAAREEWRGELEIENKAGRRITLESHVSLICDDCGRPRARVSISTDVTERNQLKEQFFRAQRLESLGMLAAGIAHDLNNVLAPMLMAPSMLLQRATDPNDRKLLTVLEKCAERGTGLVRQILGFAHGATGEHRPVQVKHLLRDLSGFIEQTFPKTIALKSEVAAELWPVHGSPTQIHQVLLNLCINARDAMPKGGTLRLNAANVSIDPHDPKRDGRVRPGDWVLLEVGDTGTGIPPEVLARIWEPFFTTKEPGKGTGLGLSTVRGLVENHEGCITLDSEPGRGTTFRVYLPASTDHAAGPLNAKATPVPRGEGELVFVVDDDTPVRDVTAATLQGHGYRVTTARDGVEALANFALRSAEFRVVVTDIDLPDLDGAALAGIFRRLNPAIKILAVSGSASGARPVAPQFADAFLAKPCRAEALLAAVHALMPAVAK